MTHWTESDKDYIEGLICEINELEDFNFFISATANPSVKRGYQWVCGSQISEVFPSSKKALFDFLRQQSNKIMMEQNL